MNDDELIERLRRTFHDRADGLQPAAGRLPVTGPVREWALGPAGGSGTGGTGSGAGGTSGPGGTGSGAGGTSGPDGTSGEVPRERQTAEYALLPPTGPVPLIGGHNRRWPPLVGGVAIVAAAAAISLTVLLSHNTHPVTTQPFKETPTTATGPGPQIVPTPSPTVATPPKSVVPSHVAASSPVPAGFQPLSVTFVSADDGWALGWASCSAGDCAVLAATTDGGYRWSNVNAPPISVASGHISDLGDFPMFEVRFANRTSGWVYTSPGSSELASKLWSTHDGGRTWAEIPVPLPDGTIGDLEASDGQVQMVVYGPCRAGSAGCSGQYQEEILSSPVGHDDWTPAPVQPAIGGGPSLSPELTLWGSSGWLVDTNRTAVSGARLVSGIGWKSWTPPCSDANGAGLVAAASATDVVALCAEGVYGTPAPGTTAPHNWLFRSTDAGNSFTPVGAVAGDQPQSVTVAPGGGQTVVMADSQQGVQASFDGGRHWTTVLPGLDNGTAAAPGGWFGYVGFTTATQGVAIRYKDAPTLYMTRDGGHTWSPVTF